MVFVEKLRRPTALVVAALFLVASMIPLLANRTASAYTLLGDREVRMSSSEVTATGQNYMVEFVVPSGMAALEGIVVAFCQDSPIIGDASCVEAEGLNLSATISNPDTTPPDVTVSDVDVSGFAAAVSNETSAGTAGGNNTITLTEGTSPPAVTAGDRINFQLDGVTNPDVVESFYARIMLYETEADANAYALGTVDPVFAGGIALSTADQITVEAKVQERITFCVYTSAINYVDCTVDADEPVILGDVNGVLSSTDPSISKDAKYNITTNASAGATIRVKGTTLESGTLSIDAIGDTALASDTGTEQFGFCNYLDTTDGAAGLTPEEPYDSAGCEATTAGQGATNADGATFAFDTGAFATTYGQAIATKTAGAMSTGILAFLGNVDDVTEPGIYTTELDFIATGRY